MPRENLKENNSKPNVNLENAGLRTTPSGKTTRSVRICDKGEITTPANEISTKPSYNSEPQETSSTKQAGFKPPASPSYSYLNNPQTKFGSDVPHTIRSESNRLVAHTPVETDSHPASSILDRIATSYKYVQSLIKYFPETSSATSEHSTGKRDVGTLAQSISLILNDDSEVDEDSLSAINFLSVPSTIRRQSFSASVLRNPDSEGGRKPSHDGSVNGSSMEPIVVEILYPLAQLSDKKKHDGKMTESKKEKEITANATSSLPTLDKKSSSSLLSEVKDSASVSSLFTGGSILSTSSKSTNLFRRLSQSVMAIASTGNSIDGKSRSLSRFENSTRTNSLLSDGTLLSSSRSKASTKAMVGGSLFESIEDLTNHQDDDETTETVSSIEIQNIEEDNGALFSVESDNSRMQPIYGEENTLDSDSMKSILSRDRLLDPSREMFDSNEPEQENVIAHKLSSSAMELLSLMSIHGLLDKNSDQQYVGGEKKYGSDEDKKNTQLSEFKTDDDNIKKPPPTVSYKKQQVVVMNEKETYNNKEKRHGKGNSYEVSIKQRDDSIMIEVIEQISCESNQALKSLNNAAKQELHMNKQSSNEAKATDDQNYGLGKNLETDTELGYNLVCEVKSRRSLKDDVEVLEVNDTEVEEKTESICHKKSLLDPKSFAAEKLPEPTSSLNWRQMPIVLRQTAMSTASSEIPTPEDASSDQEQSSDEPKATDAATTNENYNLGKNLETDTDTGLGYNPVCEVKSRRSLIDDVQFLENHDTEVQEKTESVCHKKSSQDLESFAAEKLSEPTSSLNWQELPNELHQTSTSTASSEIPMSEESISDTQSKSTNSDSVLTKSSNSNSDWSVIPASSVQSTSENEASSEGARQKDSDLEMARLMKFLVTGSFKPSDVDIKLSEAHGHSKSSFQEYKKPNEPNLDVGTKSSRQIPKLHEMLSIYSGKGADKKECLDSHPFLNNVKSSPLVNISNKSKILQIEDESDKERTLTNVRKRQNKNVCRSVSFSNEPEEFPWQEADQLSHPVAISPANITESSPLAHASRNKENESGSAGGAEGKATSLPVAEKNENAIKENNNMNSTENKKHDVNGPDEDEVKIKENNKGKVEDKVKDSNKDTDSAKRKDKTKGENEDTGNYEGKNRDNVNQENKDKVKNSDNEEGGKHQDKSDDGEHQKDKKQARPNEAKKNDRDNANEKQGTGKRRSDDTERHGKQAKSQEKVEKEPNQTTSDDGNDSSSFSLDNLLPCMRLFLGPAMDEAVLDTMHMLKGDAGCELCPQRRDEQESEVRVVHTQEGGERGDDEGQQQQQRDEDEGEEEKENNKEEPDERHQQHNKDQDEKEKDNAKVEDDEDNGEEQKKDEDEGKAGDKTKIEQRGEEKTTNENE